MEKTIITIARPKMTTASKSGRPIGAAHSARRTIQSVDKPFLAAFSGFGSARRFSATSFTI